MTRDYLATVGTDGNIGGPGGSPISPSLTGFALAAAAVVSTTNLALTGLQTVDGYTLLNADRILLTGQTVQSQNGLWAAASGSWIRPTDFASGAVFTGSRTVQIINGGADGGSTWLLATNNVTVDTTAQGWQLQLAKPTINAIPTFPGIGDDSTDNEPALAALTDAVLLKTGTYQVASDVSVSPQLVFAPGAILKPANGVTVTLSGGVEAPASQIIDMSLGGIVKIPVGDAHAHWWGAAPNTDSSTALTWAITSLAYGTSTDAHCRTLQYEDGLYLLSGAFTFSSPMKLKGRSSRGTVLQITDSFTPGDVLFTWTTAGANSDLLWEESHLPAGGMENLTVDGNGRNVVCHATRMQKCDRMQFIDVMFRNLNGSVFTGASWRESQMVAVRTWACGSPSSPYAPVVDLFDDGTGGADGHNLLEFTNCQFALSCGDHVRIGTDTQTIIVRTIWFTNCVFHGLTEVLQTYTDNYGHNGDQTLPFADGAQQGRHIIANARDIFYSACRFVFPNRGQPIFSLIQSTVVGASTINTVAVGDCNVITARSACNPFTLNVVSTVANTITVDGITLADSTVVAPHFLQTGSRIQFAPGIGGVLPTPLVTATDYFAIVVDSETFQVATTRANALASTPLTLTGAGTAPNTVTQQDIEFTAPGSSELNAANHRLSTGARVQVATTGTLPSPLAASTDYFVIRVDDSNIKLATTRANADAGTAITLTTAGTAPYWINPVHFPASLEEGVLTMGGTQTLEGTPTRAWVRVETTGALRWDMLPIQWPTGTTAAEFASGTPISSYMKGNFVLLDNTAAIYGTQTGGTASKLLELNSSNVALVGSPDTAVNVEVVGTSIVDIVGGTNRVIRVQGALLGFYPGSTPIAKQTVTGAKGSNAALGSLMTALANLGLVTDSTTT